MNSTLCSTIRKVSPARLSLAQHVVDLADAGWVDARDRLVQHDELRLWHQRGRQCQRASSVRRTKSPASSAA